MKKKFALGLLLSIFLVSFAMVGSAGATISTLADVIAAGTVPIGDKVFSGWTADISYNHTWSASFMTGDVGFTPFALPANDPGYQLALPLAVQAQGFQDLLLTYTVSVVRGYPLINDASLAANVSVTGPTASATVTENIYTDSTESVLLAQLKVYATGAMLVPYAVATFAPQSLYLCDEGYQCAGRRYKRKRRFHHPVGRPVLGSASSGQHPAFWSRPLRPSGVQEEVLRVTGKVILNTLAGRGFKPLPVFLWMGFA